MLDANASDEPHIRLRAFGRARDTLAKTASDSSEPSVRRSRVQLAIEWRRQLFLGTLSSRPTVRWPASRSRIQPERAESLV